MTGQAGKRLLKLPKAKELDEYSSDELREQLKKLRELQMGNTHNPGGNQGKYFKEHPMAPREIRRTIARIITILVRRGERCVC